MQVFIWNKSILGNPTWRKKWKWKIGWSSILQW